MNIHVRRPKFIGIKAIKSNNFITPDYILMKLHMRHNNMIIY